MGLVRVSRIGVGVSRLRDLHVDTKNDPAALTVGRFAN
jgi:hypothetical protein